MILKVQLRAYVIIVICIIYISFLISVVISFSYQISIERISLLLKGSTISKITLKFLEKIMTF